MIDVYAKNVDGVWFEVACDKQRVFGTSFAASEQEALRSLLSSIPFNVPFQVLPEPSAFAEDALTSVKNVYDGKRRYARFVFSHGAFARLYEKSA